MVDCPGNYTVKDTNRVKSTFKNAVKSKIAIKSKVKSKVRVEVTSKATLKRPAKVKGTPDQLKYPGEIKVKIEGANNY
jgi:hypothetical protein